MDLVEEVKTSRQQERKEELPEVRDARLEAGHVCSLHISPFYVNAHSLSEP